jgi:chromosome segregation ATPase
VQVAADDLDAMQMQLEVLRAAYDERAAAAAKLEIRLRQEQGVAPKVRKQLEKAQERAELFLEKEKVARGEIASLDLRLSRVTADLRARELTVKNVMADRDELVQERDEARAKAANIQVDCDFALADAANARSTVGVFKVTVDRAEKEASQAKMDLEKEREGRRKADLERAEALKVGEPAAVDQLVRGELGEHRGAQPAGHVQRAARV